jgi:hypothetical protein
MASVKNNVYNFNVRKNIRIFNLSDGRQIPVREGKYTTTDRRLALLIQDEYKGLVTMSVNRDADPAPLSPINPQYTTKEDGALKPLLNVVDDDNWDDDAANGGSEGTNTQPPTANPQVEAPVVAPETVTPPAATTTEAKPLTAAEKKAAEKAAKAAEQK